MFRAQIDVAACKKGLFTAQCMGGQAGVTCSAESADSCLLAAAVTVGLRMFTIPYASLED